MNIPQDKAEVVQSLLKYIDIFREDVKDSLYSVTGGENEDGSYFAYPVYDEKLLDFIEVTYKSGILRPDYITTMNKYSNEGDDLDDIIARVDSNGFDLRQAVLTCLVRQERFQDGLWGIAVREGWFLSVLKRLSQLLEK